jgi:hypothetical protein
MAADRIRNNHNPYQGADPRALATGDGDFLVGDRILDRPKLITEVLTLMLGAPAALVVMVLVARQGWPPWWLVVAGMLLAWTGDALWTVGDHALACRAVAVQDARRAGTSVRRVPGRCRRRRARASRAGDHR